MGGDVEHYNINMQETAPQPLINCPPPTINHEDIPHGKHNAYKFQITITIVCHKAVDPSIVMQPPVTLTSEIFSGLLVCILEIGL